MASLNAAPTTKKPFPSLAQTYQKELAFLIAQKRTLQGQIKNINKEFQGKISASDQKIKQLQNYLVTLSSDNERLINKLTDAERTLENSESNNTLLETSFSQAQVTLGLSDDQLSSRVKVEEKLNFLFQRAFERLQKGSKKFATPGEFFLTNGKKVEGEIIHFGQVARFGKFQDSSFILMPVGAGKFKAFTEKAHPKFNITAQKSPQVLPAFLYESSEKGIEQKKEQNFWEMVNAGGAIAWVIVGVGLLAFGLMLFRAFLLLGAGKIDQTIMKKIDNGKIDGLSQDFSSTQTPFTRVLKKTYDSLDKGIEEREHAIQESILNELNFLDKFGAFILVMAAVAPLLGLLGTVTGMISTFDIITEFGTGDPKLLSSGISEALITTKLGLMVAIPTLLAGNLLGGWSNKIKIMLEREALRLSNLVSSPKASEEQHA
jgi:biopolymer transport protein ExbB